MPAVAPPATHPATSVGRGVVHLRGAIVPLIDLRPTPGPGRAAPDGSTATIVVNVADCCH